VYDIETETFGKVNSIKDKFKTISMYEVEQDKIHFFTYQETDKIKKVFNRHRVVIGHNNINYDNVVLLRHNIGLDLRQHLIIDTYVIAKKRGSFLGLLNESKSLNNLSKFFKLKHYKEEDFDYSLLKKENWTDEELNKIKKYNNNDVMVTYELFKVFYDFFKPFTEYISYTNIKNYSWLLSTMSSYAYKVICHNCNIPEEYNNDTNRIEYKGGYVAEPIKEYDEDILCFDFASLYPHCFIQCNLFSPDNNGWTNKKIGMKGSYSFKQGNIEKYIQFLYDKRKEYKKIGDKREYALKIIINSLYGITANPIFKNLYHHNSARDCTAIARYCIKYARKRFNDFGYENVYTDTDSIYVNLKGKTKEQAIEISRLIENELKKEFLFPAETFKFDLDEEIKYIYFFKDKNKNRFLKKFYIYITKDDKIVIKGLPIIKNDSSQIGYIIFKKYMEEDFKKGKRWFKYTDVKKWCLKEVKNNLNLVIRKFRVNDYDIYKNPSQLQAQISKKYGKGTHYLITNNKVGVGKGKRYCTLEEFKKNNLKISDINFDKFWSEMEFFVNDIPLFDINMSENTLSLWSY
jgi:DNA polymerase elongation subunit (family B)